MTPPTTPNQTSKCCNNTVYVETDLGEKGSDPLAGTSYYVCNGCKLACDLNPQTLSEEELRKLLNKSTAMIAFLELHRMHTAASTVSDLIECVRSLQAQLSTIQSEKEEAFDKGFQAGAEAAANDILSHH